MLGSEPHVRAPCLIGIGSLQVHSKYAHARGNAWKKVLTSVQRQALVSFFVCVKQHGLHCRLTGAHAIGSKLLDARISIVFRYYATEQSLFSG
jgi:hypothetical protein